MNAESVSSAARRFFGISPYILGAVMGLLLIGRGAFGINDLVQDGITDKFLYLAHLISIAGGVGCLILVRYSLVRLIGVYAVSAGTSRVIIRFVELVQEENLFLFLLSVGMFVVSLNLVIKGISFVRGNVIRRRDMIISSSLLAVGYLLLILTIYNTGEALDIPGTEDDLEQYLLNCLTYAVLLIMLDTEPIRYNSPAGRHARHLDRIRGMYSFEPYARITPGTAECLVSRTGDMWREVDDCVVASEMEFTVTESVLTPKAVAQIWKDDGTMYITVSHEGGSMVLANTFRADIVTVSGDRLRIVGKDGTRIELLIMEGTV